MAVVDNGDDGMVVVVVAVGRRDRGDMLVVDNDAVDALDDACVVVVVVNVVDGDDARAVAVGDDDADVDAGADAAGVVAVASAVVAFLFAYEPPKPANV